MKEIYVSQHKTAFTHYARSETRTFDALDPLHYIYPIPEPYNQCAWIGYATFDYQTQFPPGKNGVMCLEVSLNGPCCPERETPVSDNPCSTLNHCHRDLLLVRATGNRNEWRRVGVGYMELFLGGHPSMESHVEYHIDKPPTTIYHNDYFHDAQWRDIIII